MMSFLPSHEYHHLQVVPEKTSVKKKLITSAKGVVFGTPGIITNYVPPTKRKDQNKQDISKFPGSQNILEHQERLIN